MGDKDFAEIAVGMQSVRSNKPLLLMSRSSPFFMFMTRCATQPGPGLPCRYRSFDHITGIGEQFAFTRTSRSMPAREGYQDGRGEDRPGVWSYETNLDVKWICKTLQRMERCDEDCEVWIWALEGKERISSTFSAGAQVGWGQ